MLVKALSAAFAVNSLIALSTATFTPNSPCVYPFTDFVYSGCFTDSPDARSLPFTSTIPFGNMTVEACVAYCKGNDYRYAGLEYYGQCFCGASVASSKAPETDCSYPCRGNSSEVCGGDGRLSVYQDTTFPDADDMATVSDYKALGCYTDGTDTSGRSLAALQNLDTSSMTTELCLNTCGSKGYVFAGTEYGGECWCGAVLANGTLAVDASSCSMPCNGNSSETCGGARLLNLYVANALDTTQPCAPPAPVSSSTPPASSSTPPVSSSSPPVSSSTPSVSSSTPPVSSSTPPVSSSTPPVSSSTPPVSSSTPPVSSSSPPVSSPPVSPSIPPVSSSTPPPVSTPSTLTTLTSSCSIPTNSYAPPPPPTTTTATTASPAPSSSCICATPTAWSGSKAVGSFQLPCVGCNDNTNQRSQSPFKLFNQKSFGQCPAYSKPQLSNACQDACKTQYTWCLSYANSCRFGNKPDSYTSANQKCRYQYAACAQVNQVVKDDGRCSTTSSTTPATNPQWYSWCNKYLSQWF